MDKKGRGLRDSRNPRPVAFAQAEFT
jgi:hypothetical protein